MDKVGKPEAVTQKRVIAFFKDKSKLNYNYIGNLRDRENRNIDTEKLTKWLTKHGYAESIAVRAVEELVKAANNLQDGLYAANREVYRLLKYGAKIKPSADEHAINVYFVDWEHPLENLFEIAEEVTVKANSEKRPDLVIFLNGIAIAVIELKKSTVSVAEGIRQNLTNQRGMFIEPFFTTMQFCMAGNDTEGLRYGTIKTEEKYYLEWKKDGFTEYPEERDETDVEIEQICDSIPNKLDSALFAMYHKVRLLNLIHNFIIFDNGRKKVCRYNQYYGIMRAQKRVSTGKGGIIWHTQGSGKSLTMIWLSKWLLSHIHTARVLVVTDRDELDEQIEKNYKGVNEHIVRTKSGKDLLDRLNSHDDRLLCSLIHKFGKRGGEATDSDYEKYIAELKASLPKDFSAKDDLYVFVDECHRTQSGKLHAAMKAIMPDAIFIGFTGTPLLKADKRTSIEVFGRYIHTYKYDEGVADGVVLDLRYEYRDIPQEIESQEKIDAWFEAKTRGLMPRAKARLKQLWGTMQSVYSSRERLDKIVRDIIFDFEIKARLSDGRGNAILVADDILAACKYYDLFRQKGFKKCAVISSYEPTTSSLRTESVSDDEDTDAFEKYRIYLQMIGIDPDDDAADKSGIAKKVEEFEAAAKKKFVDEPYNMKLLIVVDKLLTGFDAPPCTYLYIDKTMHDHGLFQAICRVNRLDGEDKEFGYIVDYKQLFGDLSAAMQTYTSGAFEGYDEEDVNGLLKDRKDEAKKRFEKLLDELAELCDGVEPPKGELEYLHYFCGENGIDVNNDEAYARIRERLYRLVNALVRAYAEVKPIMSELGYSEEQRQQHEKTVNFYVNLKATIGRSSGDLIDLKAYEPGMRYLIDNYIIAADSHKIGDFDDFTLLDFILAQRETMEGDKKPKEKECSAEAIENNIRKKIVEKIVVNPKYYEKMSAILEQLIEERKRGVQNYAKLLELYLTLAKNVSQPEENDSYPQAVRHSAALRALYDNTGCDVELALALHNAVLQSKMDKWRNNPVKEKRIKRELLKILHSKDEVERVFKIIVEQEEY